MQSRTKTIIIIVLSVVAAAIIACSAIFLYHKFSVKDESPARELVLGDTAPDFSVTLLTGETFSLSDHKGKVVFLNFWATWCSPCVAEMPAIQALSEQYIDVVFIGMDIAENMKKVQDFITDQGFTYHIGLDVDGKISKLYPTDGIPYTLVIDADGVITKTFLGGSDKMHDEFENAIKQALDRE